MIIVKKYKHLVENKVLLVISAYNDDKAQFHDYDVCEIIDVDSATSREVDTVDMSDWKSIGSSIDVRA